MYVGLYAHFYSIIEDCVSGVNSLSFCKSVLSLLVWLLNIILKSIEHQMLSTATDKALGLPVPSISGAFSYETLIDRACDGVDALTSSTTLSALLHVAVSDYAGLLSFCQSFCSSVCVT